MTHLTKIKSRTTVLCLFSDLNVGKNIFPLHTLPHYGVKRPEFVTGQSKEYMFWEVLFRVAWHSKDMSK